VACTRNTACDELLLEREGFDMNLLRAPATPAAADARPKLASYSRFLIAFSGGKDGIALVLRLLDEGVPRDKIELHHLVDGNEGSTLLDWPITEGYTKAFAQALDLDITFSWRVGGLEREMLRDNSPSAPAMVPAEGGGYIAVGGRGPLGTRRKFPQVSADLNVRWCSGRGKIDVLDAYLRNHPKFIGQRTLVLTGERAEESSARARYSTFEPHRADTRNSKKVPRHIDVWRAVHSWSESRVWEIMRQWRICAHPAYWLGYGRCSCRGCVFSSKNQWATMRVIAPAQFQSIATYEREFGVTIHRSKTVVELADAGSPYAALDPKWVAVANSREFTEPIFMDPWILPPGAFGEAVGPT
jgi:3'-phosphoadenosine 5'-phosphosulfate sulfotransferase (PAPS reductase)/FAD synthetase